MPHGAVAARCYCLRACTWRAIVGRQQTDLMLRISELEGQTIKHNLEKLKLQEDRDKLYERFREFRDKYNQLVGSKAELQTSLIEAEESKLQVSKALLDLQIENNQLKEMCVTRGTPCRVSCCSSPMPPSTVSTKKSLTSEPSS